MQAECDKQTALKAEFPNYANIVQKTSWFILNQLCEELLVLQGPLWLKIITEQPNAHRVHLKQLLIL